MQHHVFLLLNNILFSLDRMEKIITHTFLNAYPAKGLEGSEKKIFKLPLLEICPLSGSV